MHAMLACGWTFYVHFNTVLKHATYYCVVIIAQVANNEVLA